MKKILTVLTLALVVASCNKKENTNAITDGPLTETTVIKTDRIISLNGSITETLAALNEAENIVGKDVTSTFPADLKAKDLGHVRSIAAESILALQPSVVIGTSKDINPNLNDQLKKANISLIMIDQEYSVEGTKRSEEHTSELQSRENLVCRLLLEK